MAWNGRYSGLLGFDVVLLFPVRVAVVRPSMCSGVQHGFQLAHSTLPTLQRSLGSAFSRKTDQTCCYIRGDTERDAASGRS